MFRCTISLKLKMVLFIANVPTVRVSYITLHRLPLVPNVRVSVVTHGGNV